MPLIEDILAREQWNCESYIYGHYKHKSKYFEEFSQDSHYLNQSTLLLYIGIISHFDMTSSRLNGKQRPFGINNQIH